jgi:hypothetical protein
MRNIIVEKHGQNTWTAIGDTERYLVKDFGKLAVVFDHGEIDIRQGGRNGRTLYRIVIGEEREADHA